MAADASLYYRADVRRRLRLAGVQPSGPSPGHLIADAYQVWGSGCAAILEGDFAFLLYDHRSGELVGARDQLGRRGLHYAQVGRGLITATTVGAVVAHPACDRAIDALALAEIIAVSMTGEQRTPYTHVRALPAATVLRRSADGLVRRERYWHFPEERNVATNSYREAVEQLRAVLGHAVLERVAPDTPTSIWLSGGYDSSVLYAVGNDALRRAGRESLRPISVTYPVGDPGREDEWIEEIVRFWNTTTMWVPISEIPLLADAPAHAAAADVPFQHAFENWLRRLLAVSRDTGTRVALYGDGGDQLFAVSSVFLHDLFGGLRWRELHREWQARSSSGLRGLWRHVARPVLSDTAKMIKGAPDPDLGLPSWFRDDFVQRSGLREQQFLRERAFRSDLNGRAWAETRGAIVNPVIQRVASALPALAADYGVEMRAPLLDLRVVTLALSRPRAERASAGAVKHLLREAAVGLLPPNVLLPRPSKTGVLTGYFTSSFRADPDGLVSRTFAHPLLEEMGIVDGSRLRAAWESYRTSGRGDGRLFVTLQTELWLRARATMQSDARTETALGPQTPAAGFVQ